MFSCFLVFRLHVTILFLLPLFNSIFIIFFFLFSKNTHSTCTSKRPLDCRINTAFFSTKKIFFGSVWFYQNLKHFLQLFFKSSFSFILFHLYFFIYTFSSILFHLYFYSLAVIAFSIFFFLLFYFRSFISFYSYFHPLSKILFQILRSEFFSCGCQKGLLSHDFYRRGTVEKFWTVETKIRRILLVFFSLLRRGVPQK